MNVKVVSFYPITKLKCTCKQWWIQDFLWGGEALTPKVNMLAYYFANFRADTGRARLIRSHSSARFCFELSGNSN